MGMGLIVQGAHPLRIVCVGLLAAAMMAGGAHMAGAFTLTNNYAGGTDTCPNPPCTDPPVIGPASVFGVTSADVSTVGSAVDVKINTYFAGVPGTPNADGTNYGSLFLNTSPIGGPNGPLWNPSGTPANGYAADTYTPGNWNYAVVMNAANPSTPNTGTLGVYAIGAQTPVYYPQNSGVVQYYQTSNGKVVMSNVGGDPVTYPYTGNPNYWFRQGQAVEFDPNNDLPLYTGTWTVTPTVGATEGAISYLILASNGLLGDGFALSWAMTCANSIIQGLVPDLANRDGGFTTPLPAALPLFAGGLGLMGFLGRRRKRRAAASLA